MLASSLPTDKQLRHDAMMIGLVSGIAAGALVAGFIIPVVRFTQNQIFSVASAAILVAVFWSIYSPFIQKRRLDAIGRFLTHREEGRVSELTRDELHEAFRHASNFPRFMVLFNFSQWVTSGVAAGAAMVIGFDMFTLGSAIFIATAATAGGFLSQIIVFIRLKTLLAPCRDAIAEWIPDPGDRASLVRPIPLGAKLFVIMAGLMTTSALFSAGISQERSARTLESFSIAQHSIAIERLIEGIDLGDQLEEGLELAQSLYQELGVRLAVISEDGSKIEIGPPDALLEEEMSELRRNLDAGDSRAFESVSSISWRRLPEDGRILVAYSSLRELQDEHDHSSWVLVLLSAALIVISLAIARMISNDATSAVEALKALAARITEGDLSDGRIFESEDEFGELSRSLDEMSEALRSTIREVVTSTRGVEESTRDIGQSSVAVLSASAEQVRQIGQAGASMDGVNGDVEALSQAAGVLAGTVEDSSQSIRELAATSQKLGGNGNALHAQVEEVTSAIEELTRSISEVSNSTQHLAEASDESKSGIDAIAEALRQIDANASEASSLSSRVIESADRGHKRVLETIRGMQEIDQATGAAQGVVKGLGGRVTEIVTLLGVINDVADETSLLALNAAIIAAQAGERGRAFSVVADEIKGLAARVRTHTQEVGDVLHGLQEEAERTAVAIEKGAVRAKAGLELSQEAGAALEQIGRAAQESGSHTQEIVEAVQGQSSAASRMTELVQRVSTTAASILSSLTEQKRNTDYVLRSSVEMGGVASQLHAAARELTENSDKIGESLGRVEETAEGIEAALGSQKEACDQATRSLAAVTDHAHSNEAAATQMDSAYRALQDAAGSLWTAVSRFRLEEQSPPAGSVESTESAAESC